MPSDTFAVACGDSVDGCQRGEYCKTTTDTTGTTSTCTSCYNGPTDSSNKPCGDDGAACQYTGNGGNSNNCPWEMTCSNGTVFVPDETACKTCNEIVENANNHYVSNLGAASSYTVMWNGTIFSYMVSGVTYESDGWGSEPVYPTENPATCVGKPYVVNINCNGGTGCPYPTGVYRQYGNETGWFTDTSFQQQLPNSTLTPLPSRKRHLFQGYYLDPDDADTQIFDASGQLKPAGNTLISGTATLFAKWVVGGEYDVHIFDECAQKLNLLWLCNFADSYCALDAFFDDTAYNGKEFSWSIADNCGTLSSDFQKFSLSDDCDIDNDGTIEITLTCAPCPANNYCKSGQVTHCPQHTISNAGSVTRTDCKFDPNTQFNDSVGSFTLPADSNITIKWDL